MTHDFVVSLSRAAPETVTVDYGTDVGTAVAGADYTEANGTFTLAAGETEKTVAVTALDDAHHEGEGNDDARALERRRRADPPRRGDRDDRELGCDP